MQPRFLRLPANGAFTGPTHSVYVTSNSSPPSKDQVLDGVAVMLQPGSSQQLLWEQDKELMVLYHNSASLDARGYYHLGATYESLGDHAAAVIAYTEASRLSSDSELAAWALYRQAKLTMRTDIQEAILNPIEHTMDARIDLLGQAMARYPLMAELPWLAGYYAFTQRRYEDVVHFAELAVQIGCYKGSCSARKRQGEMELAAHFDLPYDLLRFAYRRLGLLSEAEHAEAAFDEALRLRTSQTQEPSMRMYQAEHRQVGRRNGATS